MFKGFGKNKTGKTPTPTGYSASLPGTAAPPPSFGNTLSSSYGGPSSTTSTTTTYDSTMPAPKKYIKINGVMKMNPEYKQWQAAQSAASGGPPPPMNPQALPVVSNMDDHAQMNEDLGIDVPLSESTNATIEMMQEPEFAMEVGVASDEMVDQLGSILGKYEVPMGLMNKRTYTHTHTHTHTYCTSSSKVRWNDTPIKTQSNTDLAVSLFSVSL
jgi:hypothetical protein